MTYTQSINYLNTFLNYESLTLPSPKRAWNLDRMRRLTALFDHPESHFVPILIAGTKGKGSTGFFLESILKASGVKVGFYTSPHLVEARERIRVQGKLVTKQLWEEELSRIHRRLRNVKWSKTMGKPTYFEILTLLAMMVFKKTKVKIAIFEIGLGGRFDATNVMDAPLSIVTPIHYDHEAFLGPTLTHIAKEKAAIIRKGAAVVLSPQLPEAKRVLERTVRKQRAVLIKRRSRRAPRTELLGDFQETNAAVALQAADWLHQKLGVPLTPKTVAKGLRAKNWEGRFEVIQGRPDLVLDVAHNPASVSALVQNLNRMFATRKRILIFGVSRDKNSKVMLAELRKFFKDVILIKVANARTQTPEALLPQAERTFQQVFPVSSLSDAFAIAKERVGSKGIITVTGSFYLVGEVKRRIKNGRFPY